MAYRNATYEHTTNGITRDVPVPKFRAMYDSVLDGIRSFHACADADEVKQWAGDLRMRVANLKAVGCKRATREDWDWRERAFDKSADALILADA
jgi:hypothetical protein